MMNVGTRVKFDNLEETKEKALPFHSLLQNPIILWWASFLLHPLLHLFIANPYPLFPHLYW